MVSMFDERDSDASRPILPYATPQPVKRQALCERLRIIGQAFCICWIIFFAGVVVIVLGAENGLADGPHARIPFAQRIIHAMPEFLLIMPPSILLFMLRRR